MKKILKATFFLLVFVTAIRSQDQIHDLKYNSDSKEKSSIQDTSIKKISFRNSDDEIILELNDELGGGSISLPPLTAIDSGESKLYNLGNTLYWDNSPIGLLEEEAPWDVNNNYISLSDPNKLVGICTLTPQQKLHVENGQIFVKGISNWFPGLVINNSIGRSVLILEGTVSQNNFSSTEFILGDLVSGKIWSILNTNLNSLTFVNHLNGTNYESSFSIEFGAPTNSLTINEQGNVGLGTWSNEHRLAVAGTIISEEIIVKLQNDWPDFVFDKGYVLPSLSEQETYIRKNNHLMNIPSAEEVKEKGVKIADIQAKLLQKIEELTLYVIQQDKEIKLLSNKVDDLINEIGDL